MHVTSRSVSDTFVKSLHRVKNEFILPGFLLVYSTLVTLLVISVQFLLITMWVSIVIVYYNLGAHSISYRDMDN